MTKVAHLSSVHPAVDTRISVKECGALAAAGYDVVLVCPHDGPDVVNGVRVAGVRRRSGRGARMLLSGLDVLRAALRERADVYHFHDAELLPVGLILRLMGATVIYDVHEDLPRQILAKSWIPGPLRAPAAVAAEGVEFALARLMSGIVAATPPIARRFPAGRTVTVQNFAMPDELRIAAPTPYHERNATFVYVGGITAIRGIFEMLAAIDRVPEGLGARLVLAGLLSEPELRADLERAPGWKRTDYLGWQTREQVAAHLDRARAGLLLIHPTRNYLDSYPGKAFEYMAAGVPLIVSDFPLWRELFESVGCALFVDPRDPAAIAAAMEWVLRHPDDAAAMGARGREAARSRFNWQAEAAKLVRLYERLLPATHVRIISTQAG